VIHAEDDAIEVLLIWPVQQMPTSIRLTMPGHLPKISGSVFVRGVDPKSSGGRLLVLPPT